MSKENELFDFGWFKPKGLVFELIFMYFIEVDCFDIDFDSIDDIISFRLGNLAILEPIKG